MPITQANRDISVTSSLGEDVLLFRAMSGTEQLGRLSEYRVQLSSDKKDIKIDTVLGKTMGIHVNLADGGRRHFNGIVTRFRCNGWDGDMASYEAIVHPALWLLKRSSNCRIFQDKSAVDIVKDVCNDPAYGGLIDLSSSALSGTYDVLTYCVQYRESDFDFICRLLEQAGIYFFFRHDESKHTMVLADSYGAHLSIGDALKFSSEDRSLSGDDAMVFSWSSSGEIVSSNYALNDFDFERAAASNSGGLLVKSTIAAAFAQQAFERYDYPGLYSAAGVGAALARARQESQHGQCERIEATSNARTLTAGGLFTLAEHPREDQNREYLVTEAGYEIKGSAYGSGGAADAVRFQVTLAAIGKAHVFRPLPMLRKPVVQGPQTAMVVGKAGEEIWTDKYGRVKVQFHWDRLGKDDENSSCWIRVMQGWAGKGWGAMFLPRVGMEVVVEFLEGDPDRPLITGCVYNGDAMPPYALPAEQTKSTIMSSSSKGGGGYNELRFEDKKGGEEIFIQAEKDFNRVVKNNDSLKVGFDKADKGDQTIAIKNDQSLDVGHDQTEHVGNDQKVSIDNNQTVTVSKDQTVTINGDQKISVAKTIVMEATTSIELKVGGSSIKIEPAKITITTAQVDIEANATVKVQASGIVTIGGALVKIN